MFNEADFLDWLDKEVKDIIENEIVFNEDIEEILYDDDWELFKMNDFEGGKAFDKDEIG